MSPHRRLRCAIAAILIAGSAQPWPMAPAVAQWEWVTHCFKKQDVDVLHPLIQRMLKEAQPGTRLPWCSTSGREGHVRLVEGGERAGAKTATVQITIGTGKAEHQWFVFHYRRDPVRGWGIVG